MSYVACWIALALAMAGQGEPEPALSIRLVRPDRQAGRLIDLFRDAPAPHPAAALARWKLATGRSLDSKAIEAALAAFNPATAAELRQLDGAEWSARLDEDGALRWRAVLPHDDGTFAAAATALALTDGGRGVPIGEQPIDRLATGSVWTARTADGLLVASSRDELTLAIEAGPRPPAELDQGAKLQLIPSALLNASSLELRRLAEGLDAAGCVTLEAVALVEPDAASLTLDGRLNEAPAPATLEPAWLDWTPADRTVAAASLALDPDPKSWGLAFAVADRVLRADPAQRKAAPLRARINLLALAVGVPIENDLWPKLRGLTAGLRVDDGGQVDGGWLVLHTTDEAAAARIAGFVLPRLAAAARLGPAAPAQPEPDAARVVGRVAGAPLSILRREADVLVSWGDGVAPACLAARSDPTRSAGPALRVAWADGIPQRAGALWPGRLRGLPPDLAAALAQAPPVRWRGATDGQATRDQIRWDGLAASVRRYLKRLPLAPAE